MSFRTGCVRFGALNKLVNPLVGAVLRSPLHRLLSARLALLTVTGRRSGDAHTFRSPTSRRAIGCGSWSAGRSRSAGGGTCGGGAPLRMRLRGRELAGYGEAIGDERTGVSVEVRLGDEGH